MISAYLEPKLRPCVIDGTKCALFHGWSQDSSVIPPSPMIGGHPGGTVSGVLGIVELKDGSVCKVNPTSIVFTDDKFEEYDWETKWPKTNPYIKEKGENK